MTYKLRYFNIQGLSLQDGEGIRSTVFLKGCPLRCLWCANPESQSTEPSEGFMFMEEKVESIVKKLQRDELFYRRSGGGVTLSGGEPFLQGESTIALLSACRDMLWDTAVETCGYSQKEVIRKAIPFTNTFYFDIKAIDQRKHIELTGFDNELILSNLKMLYEEGSSLIIRYPLIPGCNNSGNDMKLLKEWLLDNCPGIILELLPYHRFGVSKYQQLGMEYALPHVKEPSKKYMNNLAEMFNDAGIICRIR